MGGLRFLEGGRSGIGTPSHTVSSPEVWEHGSGCPMPGTRNRQGGGVAHLVANTEWRFLVAEYGFFMSLRREDVYDAWVRRWCG